MRVQKLYPLASLSLVIYAIAASPAGAAETTTHQYDALGRLISTTKSGGPANGNQTTTSYDPAGNRSNQTVAVPPPPPTPPPPPPP